MRRLCPALIAATLLAPALAWADDADVRIRATPGDGVTVTTADEHFRLQLRTRVQLQAELLETAGEPVQTETEVRRAQISAAGHVFTEEIGYFAQVGLGPQEFDPTTGSPVLEAWLSLRLARPLELRAGQMKVPYDRGFVTSAGSLQFVDYAPLVLEFALARDIGVALFAADPAAPIAVTVGAFSGEGRGPIEAPAGLLYVARAEVLPFGPFDAYVEGDLQRLPRPRVALAASAAYNHDAVRARSTVGSVFADPAETHFDYVHIGADAIAKWNGASLVAEYQRRTAAGDEVVGDVTARSAHGWLVAAGQMLTPQWEIAARYMETRAFGAPNEALDEELAREGRRLGVALSLYAYGHALKWQTDYHRMWSSDAHGLRFEDGGNQVRTKVQFSF